MREQWPASTINCLLSLLSRVNVSDSLSRKYVTSKIRIGCSLPLRITTSNESVSGKGLWHRFQKQVVEREVVTSSRGLRHGLGGPKGAPWPNSSAHATARALSLGFPGKGCLGLCLGSHSSGQCLRSHARTSSSRIIDDCSEGRLLAREETGMRNMCYAMYKDTCIIRI